MPDCLCERKFKMELSSIDTQVLTDEKWLEFVIEQILSNAIKYTAGGTISVYLKEEPEQETKELVIEDTGIGIAPEDLPRIFEKGYTGYNGHADKRSTGIGLYLCRKIMHKLSMKSRLSRRLEWERRYILKCEVEISDIQNYVLEKCKY